MGRGTSGEYDEVCESDGRFFNGLHVRGPPECTGDETTHGYPHLPELLLLRAHVSEQLDPERGYGAPTPFPFQEDIP